MPTERALSLFKKLARIHLILAPLIFIATFIILGQIQPDYNPIRLTISRLVLGEYGWVQNLNFIQLALALLTFSAILSRRTDDKQAQIAFRMAFGVSAATLILAALFPTDPATDTFIIRRLTIHGYMHVVVVLIFLLMTPLGVRRLAKAFDTIPYLSSLKGLTLICGYTAVAMSYSWLAFYPIGLGLGVMGLLQKIIAVWILIWLEITVIKTLTAKSKPLP